MRMKHRAPRCRRALKRNKFRAPKSSGRMTKWRDRSSAPGSVSGRPAIPAGLKLPLRFLSADGANPGRAIFGGRSGTTVADLAGPRVIVVMENPYFGQKRYAWEVRIQVFRSEERRVGKESECGR